MTLVPALVGAALADQFPAAPGEGLDNAGLLVQAATDAVADASGSGLAGTVDLVLVTRGLSLLPDGAGRIAEALGVPAARAVAYDVGIPQQTLINRAIDAVRTGEARTVVVAGAETKRSTDIARRAGVELAPHVPLPAADELVSPEGEIVARPEIDIDAVAPVQQYALIDSARRAANRWSLDEHRDDIAGLWASFNEVSRTNPRAAFPTPMSATAIRDPGPDNRALAFPYNKWHNSQWGVDQAAAFVITSSETARDRGVPIERMIFPRVGLESSQSLSLSRRADLHRWPAMRVLGEAAAEHLGRPLSAIDHVELYSCFPAAVRVQQADLELDPDNAATITGGMTFAGGPFNNFVFQATVAMIERLRAEPGSTGLVTAVSGLLTKPGLAVWSTTPPDAPALIGDLADRAAAATAVAPLNEDPVGPGRIATYTVAGPRIAAIIDLDSGDRAVAALDDVATAERATQEDLIGTRVHVDGRSFAL